MTEVTSGRRRRGTGPAVIALIAVLAAGAAAASALALRNSGNGRSPRALVQSRSTALGRVLVDRRGRTLYLFEADHGTRSSCYGACAAAWPPLLTHGTPRAAAGIRRRLLGTTRRKDGSLQVTYHRHPLYLFVKDRRAGTTSGEGIDAFGGEWYALDRAGRKVERTEHTTTTTPTTTTPTTTGGYGYGG